MKEKKTKKLLYHIIEFRITSDAFVHIFSYREYIHYTDLNFYAVDLAIFMLYTGRRFFHNSDNMYAPGNKFFLKSKVRKKNHSP
jgi:hypothetical protein